MPMLNDVHSRLNATEMLRVANPSNVEEVRAAVNDSALRGEPMCPAGSLHSMGGQQFAGGGFSLSSSPLTAIGPLQRDPSGGSGIVQVQAGVTWPMLVRWLRDADSDGGPPLSIIQKQTGANVVYGTVRLIEAEDETFLRWAKRDFACIIFNLLVEHSPAGIDRGQAQFQSLIDCALNEGGCYYLTYHRWARPDQVERAYPEFREFLDLKDHYDPHGVFTSEWHRYHRQMFR